MSCRGTCAGAIRAVTSTSKKQVLLIVAVVVCAAAPHLRASAQQWPTDSLPAPVFDVEPVDQQPAGPPPTPRHTGIKAMLKGLGMDVKHLPSRENLWRVAVGSGLALAVHPLDDNVNRA